MVISCCAVGCSNRYGGKPGLGFFRFPLYPIQRRRNWIAAVRRKDWDPGRYARICGEHFVTGKPVQHSSHVDYVPSVFSYKSQPVAEIVARQRDAHQERMDRRRSLTTTAESEEVSEKFSQEARMDSVSCTDQGAENEEYGCHEVQAVDCSIQTEDCILLHKDTQTNTKHTTESATQTSFPQTMSATSLLFCLPVETNSVPVAMQVLIHVLP